MALEKTYIQISDLHLANVDAAGVPDYPGVAKLWPVIPLASGFWGHDPNALSAIEDFFFDTSPPRRDAQLIVTGDLTSIGNAAQFDLAIRFLSSRLQLGIPGSPGLGVKDWLERGIPGNHDHWPGTYNSLGTSTDALKDCFKPDPPPSISTHAVGGQTMTLIRINTDVDVGAFSQDRAMAWGKFVSHIRWLDSNLSPRKPGEFRVMLAHHSYGYRGLTLRIDPVSLRALRRALARHQISVLLTGHTHVGHIELRQVWDDLTGARWETLETCCGTSSQDADPPDYVRKRFGMPPKSQLKFAPNQVMLHEVHQDFPGAPLRWVAQSWGRDVRLSNGKFVPMNVPFSDGEIDLPA
jgi:3',5'-cyclic AMP phosphodiesterase CpdA